MGTSIATFFVRRKAGGGKKLIGVPFVAALFFQVLSRLLYLIGGLMYECSDLSNNDYINLSIAANAMIHLANWALLVTFVYVLNSMLLRQLKNSSSGPKIVSWILIGVMAAVMVADLAFSSYISTSSKYWDFDFALTILIARAFSLTADILWMISVIISAAFSLSSISALRSRRLPGGDLIGWVAALFVTLFIYSVLGIVFSSLFFWPDQSLISNEALLALSFISAFSQVLTFVALMCIAKHISWSQTIEKTELVYVPVMQQQQATDAYGNGQQGYYQQTPELVHAK
ncbi:hypothetical protein ACET3X_007643 [Alternaria dauci]|uniref:Uncharacterized protein n=1 Tax=Alternaria dauci TaxID=48095 RepID=A0ABR3UDF8_9PLEO